MTCKLWVYLILAYRMGISSSPKLLNLFNAECITMHSTFLGGEVVYRPFRVGPPVLGESWFLFGWHYFFDDFLNTCYCTALCKLCIEILSPNTTQELHTKSRGSHIASIAYIANIITTATTIIPKITFTSFTCPFKPNKPLHSYLI
jgi:hypothetical protein